MERNVKADKVRYSLIGTEIEAYGKGAKELEGS
jgi:hypothetical protein